ncbi:hypothetical protein DZB85_09845 [Bacillus sp. LB(2018)]|nr:hypothetical protein COJ40_03700 [Bacillus cereus]RFB16358.1 hypothetical protein DZB88_04970 [Bacillus sp. OE]RFB24303.1 hypothetical protein DZB85_09845 [Bacillus sp. LB(2018)]RFB50036.1 hypothetical protein DZB83_01595 [Bacillus sp. dmp10]RFB77035.1 hypothetical protein DZB94_01605 [Bacillus sp. AW]
MLNNENKVKKPLKKEVFLLCSLLIIRSLIEGCVERIVFIVSMLIDYGSVKRGNNIGRIVAVH